MRVIQIVGCVISFESAIIIIRSRVAACARRVTIICVGACVTVQALAVQIGKITGRGLWLGASSIVPIGRPLVQRIRLLRGARQLCTLNLISLAIKLIVE